MDVMDAIARIPGIGPFLPYVAALVAVAAAVAPFLPPPKLPASGFYPVIYGLVNWLALNLGHAKNATSPSTQAPQQETAMRRNLPAILALGLVASALVACSADQQQKVQTALSSPLGQLFCGIATASGPIVAGMIEGNVSGSAAPIAIIATDKTQAYVAATCAAAGGVPVSPPANPAAAPQVAVKTF